MKPVDDSGRSRAGHLPALDGIRGIAILLVLLAHGVDFLGPVPRHIDGKIWPNLINITFLPGWGGVDLFFALSGFLITGILLRARGSRTYFSSFYARRVLRIFPIYYLFLIASLVCAPLSFHLAALLPDNHLERVSYFLYLQNWPIFWKSWAGMTGLWGAYWSLAVEEQFYLVWPSLIAFVKPRTMFVLCLLGFLCGLPERVFMVHHVGLLYGLMQWPFSRLDGLFLGAAIALYREAFGRAVPLRIAAIAFAIGGCLHLWLVVFHYREVETAGLHLWSVGPTAFALMSAGLIAAVEFRPPFLIRILSLRPLVLAGRYSYGMYVYHLIFYFTLQGVWFHWIAPRIGYHLVTSLAFIALTVVLVTAVAAFSFRFIETPFLRLKRYFPSPAAPV